MKKYLIIDATSSEELYDFLKFAKGKSNDLQFQEKYNQTPGLLSEPLITQLIIDLSPVALKLLQIIIKEWFVLKNKKAEIEKLKEENRHKEEIAKIETIQLFIQSKQDNKKEEITFDDFIEIK